MAVLLTPPYLYFTDNNGVPLAGGLVYTYTAGTDTPKATFTDYTEGTDAANPVVLDAYGRATIWITGSYKFVVRDSAGVLIKTTDNVTAFNIPAASANAYFQSFSGDGTTTVFTASTDLGTDEKEILVFVNKNLQACVTNGTFATDTGWTKGTGWTIAAGVADAAGAISVAISQTAPVTLVEGQAYAVVYTITRAAGGLIPSVGGRAGTERTASGTYSEIIIAGSSQTIAFTGNAFTGTLDTITISPAVIAGPDVINPSSYTINGTSLTFSTAPPIGTNNIFVFAPSLLLNAASSSADAAATSATLASQWASLTSGIVAATDYSAKAWAIGGTGVTTTSGKGAAKEWATTTAGAVDTAEYSAKAYAIGGTGVTTTSGKGAAKEWATSTGAAVDTSEFSSKEYAIGTTATLGSAKSWATLTSGLVASTDGSAKAWAIGGTGISATASAGASKEWATKTSAAVDTSEFSAKAYAIGGTGITSTSGKGAAKEWAITTGAAVDTSEYSAKEYAVGTTVAAGSAKDWATKTSAAVSTTFSAKEYAQGTQAATGGSAKNWASQTGADVTGASANDRSAKSWAQEAITGATLGGSAKDWAQSASLPDGTNKSAKSYAADAAASAVTAASEAAKITGTSTTSLAISVASKTFTTQASKQFNVGQFMLVVSDAAPATDWMFGQITAYSGTGLDLNVTVVGGSGTHTDWTLYVAGARGATGPAGTVGDGDFGDITVSSSGAAWTIDNGVVSLAKMANLAQDQFIGRTTASTGVPETATITAAARTVLDDATVGAMVDTLGGGSSTGTGGLVRATSPTFVTPLLGTPTSGVLTNCTGLPVAGGGTGLTTLTANNVILGAGTSTPTFVAPSTSGNVLTSNGTTWTSAAPAGGGGLTVIASGSFGAVTLVDITSIPQTYRGLVLYVVGASNTVTTRALMVEINCGNGLGSASNLATYAQTNNATVTAVANATKRLWTAQTQANTAFGGGILTIYDYQSGAVKNYKAIFSAADNSNGNFSAGVTGLTIANGVLTNDTSPETRGVTGIRITWDNVATGVFDAGTYALYGVN